MYKKSIPNILENMTSAIDEFFVKSEVCYHMLSNMTFYCEFAHRNVDFIEHFLCTFLFSLFFLISI